MSITYEKIKEIQDTQNKQKEQLDKLLEVCPFKAWNTVPEWIKDETIHVINVQCQSEPKTLSEFQAVLNNIAGFAAYSNLTIVEAAFGQYDDDNWVLFARVD